MTQVADLVNAVDTAVNQGLHQVLDPIVNRINEAERKFAIISSMLKELPEYKDLLNENRDLRSRIERLEGNVILEVQSVPPGGSESQSWMGMSNAEVESDTRSVSSTSQSVKDGDLESEESVTSDEEDASGDCSNVDTSIVEGKEEGGTTYKSDDGESEGSPGEETNVEAKSNVQVHDVDREEVEKEEEEEEEGEEEGEEEVEGVEGRGEDEVEKEVEEREEKEVEDEVEEGAEEGEEEEEEEEKVELHEIVVECADENGEAFDDVLYTNDDNNGTLYEKDEETNELTKVGQLVNGEPEFYD